MHRITLASAICILFMMVVSASGQGLEKPLDATIGFSERTFEFGFMPAGTTVMHTFTLRNDGSDTLRIIRVKPTCGCTNAPLSKTDLGPGETADLDVFFDSRKFKGKVVKKVSILSNDPKDPYSEIAFSAQIESRHPLLDIDPMVVEADKIEGGSYRVKLSNTSDESLKLEILSESAPYVETKLSRDEVAPGQTADLMVKINDNYNEVKNPWYSITIQTNDPMQNRVSIPIKLPNK